MAAQPYAKILMSGATGIIQTLQVVDPSTDTLDSNFTWVSLVGVSCTDSSAVLAGCAYDSGNGHFSSLPLDTYGRAVTFSTDGTTDTYTVKGKYVLTVSFQVANSTSQTTVYTTINASSPTYLVNLAQAIQLRLLAFQADTQTYAQSHYTTQTQVQFLDIYTAAMVAGNLPDRAAYCTQAFTWANSLFSYSATVVAAIQALTSISDALNYSWDFGANVSTDPMITVVAAILINT